MKDAKYKKPLETVNLKDITYAIRKKRIDPAEPITIKTMFEAGMISRCKYGVRILGKGYSEFLELGQPVNLEVQDATQAAVNAVKELGGSVKAVYHTPFTIKRFIHSDRFHKKEVETPMPPPYTVLKLEGMRDKGMEVEYPEAPWYEEYKAEKEAEAEAAAARAQTEGEKLVPKIPMPREPGQKDDVPKVERP